jgi:hypothetical protein
LAGSPALRARSGIFGLTFQDNQRSNQPIGAPMNLLSFFSQCGRWLFYRRAAMLLGALLWAGRVFGGDIHDATASGDLDKVRALLKDYPFMVLSMDDSGRTPLHIAAENGDTDMMRLLLASKADVNARNNLGQTPLHTAAAKNHLDAVELLLANKADVNARDNDGDTPRHWAVKAGGKDVAELLRRRGDPDTSKIEAGSTPAPPKTTSLKAGLTSTASADASDEEDGKISYAIEEQRLYGMASANGAPPSLRGYSAKGTVSVGENQMQVVGGIPLDGSPALWVNPHNLARRRVTVAISTGAFPRLPSKNESVGAVTSASLMTGVRFSEALFMSSAPAKDGSVQEGAPPFFFYLSPLSGAKWEDPKDTPPNKSALPYLDRMTVNSVAPDLYAYRYMDPAGKVVWIRNPYFVAINPGALSRDNLVRIEEVEFSERARFNGVFLKKFVIALQGLEGAGEFPNHPGKPMALAFAHELSDERQWSIEDEAGTKSLLLKQEVDLSGAAILVFGNGISLPTATLLKTLR